MMHSSQRLGTLVEKVKEAKAIGLKLLTIYLTTGDNTPLRFAIFFFFIFFLILFSNIILFISSCNLIIFHKNTKTIKIRKETKINIFI